MLGFLTVEVLAKGTRGFPKAGLRDIKSYLTINSSKVAPLAMVSADD
jgi:hypothetical protein